jgi:hypothetical protein
MSASLKVCRCLLAKAQSGELMGTRRRSVVVAESADNPYGQAVTIGPHTMRADEAEILGGHDIGPSPYEYVMAGLGACMATTLRMYADRHGWPLGKTSVPLSPRTNCSKLACESSS